MAVVMVAGVCSGASLTAIGRLERDTDTHTHTHPIGRVERDGVDEISKPSPADTHSALHTSAPRCSNIQLRRSSLASSPVRWYQTWFCRD